jgi:hypothetical protein
LFESQLAEHVEKKRCLDLATVRKSVLLHEDRRLGRQAVLQREVVSATAGQREPTIKKERKAPE